MKKNRLLSIILALALVFTMMPVFSFAATSKSDSIVILATSDIHSSIASEKMGFVGLSAVQKEMESQYKNVVLVDNGDAIQGGSVGSLTNGIAIVKLMNAIGYDIVVPGNHDFDYGVDYFLKDIAGKALNAEVVSCNIKKVNAEKTYFQPYVIKKYGDKKVAFVGISTPETMIISRPLSWLDEKGNKMYDFCGGNLQEQVQKSVDAAIAEGADYVVALGHLGISGGEDNPWKSDDVISNTHGIDVFVDGHSHSLFTNTVKNSQGKEVPRIAVGTNLEHVGKIEIQQDGTITTELIDEYSADAADAKIAALVDKTNKDIEKKTSQKIGTAKYNLITHNSEGKRLVRKQETNLGDFCADAARTVMGSDIGFYNGGGLRAELKKGDITMGTIIDIFPFGNMICECEATGQEILDALELSVMNIGKADGEDEFGGFLQVSGITYCIDPSVESTVVLDDEKSFVKVDGARKVYNVKVGEVAIDPNKTYTVASHNFKLKSGGDGYTMFMDNKFTQDEVMLDIDMLIEYITKNLNGTIGARYAKSQNRIFIGTEEEYEAAVKKELAETKEKLAIAEYEPALKAKAAKKSVKLSWNTCDNDGVQYKLYRQLKNGKFKLVKTTSKTSYTVKKLNKGKKYQFRVRASKLIGGETYSGHYSKTVKCKAK